MLLLVLYLPPSIALFFGAGALLRAETTAQLLCLILAIWPHTDTNKSDWNLHWSKFNWVTTRDSMAYNNDASNNDANNGCEHSPLA